MQRFAPFTNREDRSSRNLAGAAVPVTSAQVLGRSLNEQSLADPVKGVMDRTKIAFTALLPALLLLVCGQGLSAQCVGCSSKIFGDKDLTFHAGKDCSPDAVSSHALTARRVTWRLAKSGHVHTFFVHPICRSSFLEGTSTQISAPRENGIPLATHWQFALRMALDPRAPSSVS